MNCILCQTETRFFYHDGNYNRTYHQCKHCKAVLLDPEDYVSREEEAARYKTHNNDIHDPGYRKFVQPVVNRITSLYTPEDSGLDYGCGPGPVITNMLREKGYRVRTYDPIFNPNEEVLNDSYDYIFCCEVVEHFHRPDLEFKKLKTLLKPGGQLICKTDLYSKDTDFPNWYYKNDETHVIFFHSDSLQWIKDHFGYDDLQIEGRQFILKR